MPTVLLVISCSASPERPVDRSPGWYSDSCSSDSEHAYEVYLPETREPCSIRPLIVVIDPQGKAKEAIQHFKSAADEGGFVVVASTLLRNRQPEYMRAIGNLVNDVQLKYPVGRDIYLAGFSGGARMALAYAAQYSVRGVLACGAIGSVRQLQKIEAPVLTIGGLSDFNFVEVAQYIFRPKAAPQNLFIELNKQGHNWPSDTQITSALSYLALMNSSNITCYPAEAALTRFTDAEQQRIEDMKKGKDYLLAGLLARNLSRGVIFNDYHDFVAQRNSLEYGAPFMAELERLKESIRMELSVRKAYSQALQQEDFSWWQSEINVLDQRIAENQDSYQKFALQRIKAFLGMLCYSMSHQSLQMNNMAALRQLLPIYEPGAR